MADAIAVWDLIDRGHDVPSDRRRAKREPRMIHALIKSFLWESNISRWLALRWAPRGGIQALGRNPSELIRFLRGSQGEFQMRREIPCFHISFGTQREATGGRGIHVLTFPIIRHDLAYFCYLSACLVRRQAFLSIRLCFFSKKRGWRSGGGGMLRQPFRYTFGICSG